jgi:hypothetical protein
MKAHEAVLPLEMMVDFSKHCETEGGYGGHVEPTNY